MNREERRAAERDAGPIRPRTDLHVSRIPAAPYVYIGLTGAGAVRLTLEEARELGFALLETAGDPQGVDGGPTL